MPGIALGSRAPGAKYHTCFTTFTRLPYLIVEEHRHDLVHLRQHRVEGELLCVVVDVRHAWTLRGTVAPHQQHEFSRVANSMIRGRLGGLRHTTTQNRLCYARSCDHAGTPGGLTHTRTHLKY